MTSSGDGTRGTVAGTRPPLDDARMSLGSATIDDLFPEGEAFRASVQTFVVLLALAALIATFGLMADSVAAIIGAMVVAPLGGAMMALAGALVTGRSRWQLNSLLEVVLGSLMVVAIGFLVAAVLPDPLDLNPSLDARTAPGLLDLGVALAAGAAGAYVTVRRTGSDALPGVAIAVSLVPPLATAGICLELGRIDEAIGALTLFLANFAAIVVVAALVFVLCGVRPTPMTEAKGRMLRRSLAFSVVALVVISIPLAIRAADNVRIVLWSRAGAPVVESWLAGQDLRLDGWIIEDATVTLAVRGSTPPAGVDALAGDLAAAIGQPIELVVDYVPSDRTVAPGVP